MRILTAAKSVQASLLLAPLVWAVAACAEVPVTDVGTSRNLPVSGGVAVERDNSGGADGAVTYGASSGYDDSAGNRNGGYSAAAPDAGRSAPVTGNAALLNQVKQMQEDLDTLRGQVEEQANEIRKLKQQQTDDFANLDRRIGSGAPASAEAPAADNEQATDTGADAPAERKPVAKPAGNTITASSGDGKDDYEAAYGMLKAKNYDGAATKFKAITTKYPNGEYTANSLYWLGQINLIKSNLDVAQQNFAKLIKQFPDHTKVPEAKYNLGKIYCQQGDTAKGKALLKEVAAGDSKAAALAKTYLGTL